MTRVCVVTGTRAEYGLLRWLMEEIHLDPALTLQILVTGAHLSPEFGSTFRQIEQDGFAIDARVDMLVSGDTPVSVTKSMGLGLIGFADALDRLRPDVVVLLGDRYETWAVGAACTVARVPIAHVHGGEVTEGAIDEAIRHGLTKMARLHFVAAPEYGDRVVQLGEDPTSVHIVGGLGLDSIERLELVDRAGLESALGIDLGHPLYVVTYHPVTLGTTSRADFAELLTALDEVPDATLVFTMPNADSDGRALAGMVDAYVAARANAHVFTSLGQTLYLSLLREADAVVGNSSSGLLEAPSLGTPTVNIGDRQRGRLAADSVIACDADRASIRAALETVASPEFRERARTARNPYGVPGASMRIARILADTDWADLPPKRFHDLPAQPVDGRTDL